MLEQLKKYLALILIALMLVATGWGYYQYKKQEDVIADLRNQVALKDKTIEELHNVYTKLATENTDLKSQNPELQELLKKARQDLIAETQAKLYWKGQFDYVLKHGQGTKPSEPSVVLGPSVCTDQQLLYTSTQDIGVFKLVIGTTTFDPQYQQKLTIGPGDKPLVLTVDFTRDRKKQWRTHINSSDERIGVDIGINSVNIEPLDEHWYERLKLTMDVGGGSGGLLGGFGVIYEFGKWEAGPKVWADTSGKTYAGATFTWAPFKQAF